MNIEEMFDEISKRATEINKYWKENRVSSKKIRKEIEYNFFHNKTADFYLRFAHFYALENRIDERYNGFLKTLFRFFSWKNETKLLSKIKRFLKYPDHLDAKSIIIEKCDDMANEKTYLKKNSENKDGLKVDKKIQDEIIKHGETIKENAFENEKFVSDLKEETHGEILQKKDENKDSYVQGEDIIVLDEVKATTDKDTEKQSQFYNINQEQLTNKQELGNKGKIDVKNNKDFFETREKIEISKDDLLNTKPSVHNSEKTTKEIKVANNSFSQIQENASKNNEIFAKNENNNADNIKNKDNFIPQYEHLKSDINFNNTLHNLDEKKESINVNYNKLSQNNEINNYKISEQQKSEIIAEEISKLSEQELQSIKNFMQEEMDKQMKIAEEKGDIYKMPISIKEVIDSKTSEKSEVQSNKSNDSVLKNNKKR